MRQSINRREHLAHDALCERSAHEVFAVGSAAIARKDSKLAY